MSVTERTLDALFVVTGSHQPMTANEIAAALSIPLSTAYRHIAILKKYDLIADLGRQAGFAPGIGCWRIGRSYNEQQILSSLSFPAMEALASKTQESVGLLQAVAGDVLCLEMIDSKLSLRCSFTKGSAQPLRTGASAKSLLAFMADSKRDLILKSSFPAPLREKFIKELNLIRDQGYAESESEVDLGVWGVSAPVFSGPDQLECTISLMSPVIRVGDRRRDFIAATIHAAQSVTNQLNSINYKNRG